MSTNACETLQTSLLVEPVAKDNCVFPRAYPFPIIKDESQENGPWNCIIGHLKDQCVEVTDEENMICLFTMGFFGKASFSRSTPQVLEEKLKPQRKGTGYWQNFKRNRSFRINNDEESEIVVCEEDSEENPSKRMKRNEDEDIEVLSSDSNTNDRTDNVNSNEVQGNDSLTNTVIEKSGEKEEKEEKEVLQLTFEEAFFLSYGLGCLIVKDKDQPLDLMKLWYKFCELHLGQNFPVMYTAYHHYRSKGWIVRSGLKYGADYALYKDGPPFYHSTYLVIVKPVKEQNLRDINTGSHSNLTWATLAGLNRVCSHVCKAIIILYVIKPASISENKISTPFCVSQYKLQEVRVKRWIPSETRDED